MKHITTGTISSSESSESFQTKQSYNAKLTQRLKEMCWQLSQKAKNVEKQAMRHDKLS